MPNNYELLPYAKTLPQSLYWVVDSGKIVYRKKVNTLIGIDHPAIILGEDSEGYLWVVHHHYRNIYPTVDRIDKFSLGADVYYDPRQVCYDRYQIVQRAILAWMEKREYHWLWQNCQHFVNGVACNDHRSEAIDTLSDGALIASAILGIFGLATKDKGLINLALGTAVVGGAMKTLNGVRVTPALNSSRNILGY